MEAPRIEVINLSNGLLCPHLDGKHPMYPIGPYRFARIQSTQCEMKQWDSMIMGAFGPDLWLHLALGHELVVHDHSEKPYKHNAEIRRETRACWQGMQLIRYVAERMWDMPVTWAYGRNRQQPMNPQFDEIFQDLNGSTKNYVRYFRNHRDQLGKRPEIRLTSCWREEHG